MSKLQLTVLLLFITVAGGAQTKNFIDQPYVEVNGAADTLVIPNEIYIRITLSEKDTRDRISVEEQEAKMVAALQSLGINTEKDLSTYDIMNNYKFYLLKNREVVKTKQYLLKVTEASTAHKVFMQLENLAISTAAIDRVDHSDLESIRNTMRVKAVKNAKARAAALIQPLNQVIGQAIFISDNEGPNVELPLPGRAAGVVIRGYDSMRQQVKEELLKIEFEKIRVTGAVNVKFMLQ